MQHVHRYILLGGNKFERRFENMFTETPRLRIYLSFSHTAVQLHQFADCNFGNSVAIYGTFFSSSSRRATHECQLELCHGFYVIYDNCNCATSVRASAGKGYLICPNRKGAKESFIYAIGATDSGDAFCAGMV